MVAQGLGQVVEHLRVGDRVLHLQLGEDSRGHVPHLSPHGALQDLHQVGGRGRAGDHSEGIDGNWNHAGGAGLDFPGDERSAADGPTGAGWVGVVPD